MDPESRFSCGSLEAEIGIVLGAKEILGEPPGQVERDGLALGGLAEELERGKRFPRDSLSAEDPHHLPGKISDLPCPPFLQVKIRQL